MVFFLLCFRYGLLFILSFRYDFLLFHYVMRGKFHYVMRGNGLQQPINSIAGCLNHSLDGPDTSGLLGFLGFRCIFFFSMRSIHRNCWVFWVSDVFCFGNFWRYIGNSLYWPIPMYILDRFEPPYIGMGIEISIPMYRLLKLVQ